MASEPLKETELTVQAVAGQPHTQNYGHNPVWKALNGTKEKK